MANPVGITTTKWLNADGLLVSFGRDEAVLTRGGEFEDVTAGRHCVEVSINLPTLPAFDATADSDVQIVADNVVIPQGALLEQVDVICTKETAGTNANLDLGLVRLDRVTGISYVGLLNAGDDFNGGTDLGKAYSYTLAGGGDAGDKLGTVLTHPALITARADTANWSAGVVQVRVFYSIPLTDDL